MKEINFYKEMISQIEKNERKLKVYYSDVSNYSIKKYITDFIKQIAKRSGSVDKAFSMMMPSPEQLEDQTFLIKNPVKVKINPNGTHQLFSNFGTGYFSNPKVFDKNVYCKEQHCHSAAFMFAISHLDLQPVILTGFYDRLEKDLDDLINNFDKNMILKTADSAKSLILKLEEFKSVIALSAQNRTVYTICRYVQELAAEFHSFYNSNRVICDDVELMKSRLALMVAIRITLKNALDILAVSAPEKM